MAQHSSRKSEFAAKLKRIRGYLAEQKLDAVLLSSQALFAWATAGGDNYVVTASEGGVAHFLVTRKDAVVLTNKIEAGRVWDEELSDLGGGVSIWQGPWYADNVIENEVLRRVGNKRWQSDTGFAGGARTGEDFLRLTYTLTPEEIARYRVLGKECSQAMEAALEELEPGMTEHALAGEICKALWGRGIRPHLALVASDERAFQYRHPIPKSKKIKKHVMAVLCGKRGGLIVNLTRMVHFGKKLPTELQRKHDACCAVDIALNAETRVGAALKDVFAAGVDEYARKGFADEWTLHHQGGPTGYQGRSYVGKPTEARPVLLNQAFAWNPSIAGTKSEDTILVLEKGIEFISGPSEQWPIVNVTRAGKTYARADIQLR